MTPPPSLQELIQTVQQDSPSTSPLDLLITASSTVSQLEDLNDALLEHFVSACRREGKSWSEISAALGVTIGPRSRVPPVRSVTGKRLRKWPP